jgi:hypothetical protein
MVIPAFCNNCFRVLPLLFKWEAIPYSRTRTGPQIQEKCRSGEESTMLKTRLVRCHLPFPSFSLTVFLQRCHRPSPQSCPPLGKTTCRDLTSNGELQIRTILKRQMDQHSSKRVSRSMHHYARNLATNQTQKLPSSHKSKLSTSLTRPQINQLLSL